MVPEYPAWEIERKAAQLLSECYPEHFPQSHVDIEWVVEAHLGLEIVPVPGIRRGWQVDGVICQHPQGTYFIVVDEETLDRNPYRYRFTLGEEVGHFVLHAQFLPQAKTVQEALAAYARTSNWQRLDRNARRFAAALLMPMRTLVPNAEQVYRELVAVGGFRDHEAIRKYMVSRLAKSYCVSSEAMSFRLREYPAHLDRRIAQALRERLMTLP